MRASPLAHWSFASLCAMSLVAGCNGKDTQESDPTTPADTSTELPPEPLALTVFDEVVFYDGYAGLVSEPVPEGVQRLRNDLITRRLDDAELDAVLDTLALQVVIGALCDNYDRIGSVALAFVPKGQTTYVAGDVERIELGRFITPFMNMNKRPKSVSYDFDVSNVAWVFNDEALRSEFDLWLELEVFGVPYAANAEIPGCEGRDDVFLGTLNIASDLGESPSFDTLLPLTYKASFNNYQEGASDALGTTRKTVPFTLQEDAADAELVLVISNHGANVGGEEYERREHLVYVDDELQLSFVPGRESCEPFREYNTQSNGIYGRTPRSDEEWQSFSNWCPGDVIDTRVFPLGPLSAGEHSFVVDVPDAVFVGGEGYFPHSSYVQTRR
jgi:hypothetical protein